MTLHAFLLSPSLPLADWPATVHLLGAFALHLFFSLILVFVLYYQKSKRFLPVPAFAGFLNLGSDV